MKLYIVKRNFRQTVKEGRISRPCRSVDESSELVAGTCQVIRYMMNWIVHEMGTGKTCTAIAAIERLSEENNGIRGALYIARGDALVDNFVNELLNKLTVDTSRR